METLARSAAVQHATIRVETEHPTQFIDITDEIGALVETTRVESGLVNVQSLHTTTAVVVNEHEPLLLTDIASLLEHLAPQDGIYRHDNVSLRSINCILGERPNGHSHCRAWLLGAAACLNIADGRVRLGRWQRIFFVELDGPRSRDISVMVMGEATR